MKQYPAINTNADSEVLPNYDFNIEYVHTPTIEGAKQFFGPIALEERAWRNDMCFDALLQSPRSKLGIGEHDRAEAYIFGNGSFPEGDKVAHRSHFPVSVKVLQIEELFIAPYEVVDLTANAKEFPWDTGESEIYLHLTIKRLILSAQSKLVVKGNVFILNCTEAIANNLNGSQAIIELSGSDWVQHRHSSRFDVIKKIQEPGRYGADGEPLIVESTPLGLRVSEGTDACKGQDGANGNRGESGNPGRNGAMLFLSDLRFGTLTGFGNGSIKLKAAAGAGFPGGNGRDGGDGGKGGNGAAGMVTPFGMVKGWPGGRGGCGGDGGNGGRGGNGGLCCDVFVSAPPQASYLFEIETFASPGGSGGIGGKGGEGGAGGLHGKYYESESGVGQAPDGADGVNAMRGPDGKTREAAKVHIYERIN